MILSKRLETVANMVTKGAVVADIGCDHAYVSIYLLQHQIVKNIIAMDINKGPLQRAKENIAQAGLEERIELRLSDGAQKLSVGEVDTLVIAGMGGALMSKILSSRQEVVDECRELILQPQSEIFLVRKYLLEHGFKISEERMLIEDGKFYTIIKAHHGIQQYEQPIYYKYGKYLLEHKNETLREFLQREYKKTKKVHEYLVKQDGNHEKRLLELECELKYIKEGLKYYDL